METEMKNWEEALIDETAEIIQNMNELSAREQHIADALDYEPEQDNDELNDNEEGSE